jgi:hypothetical protein
MDDDYEIQTAKIILTQTGLFDNRSILVQEIERELETIYSELDNTTHSSKSNTPIRYYEEVQTEFDLISNNLIHRSLNKLQTKEQKIYIRKITHNEDFYFSINRGSGHNFVQEWSFNFRLKKEDFFIDYDETFSFTFKVGVRDPYPYEIDIESFSNVIDKEKIRSYFLAP